MLTQLYICRNKPVVDLHLLPSLIRFLLDKDVDVSSHLSFLPSLGDCS